MTIKINGTNTTAQPSITGTDTDTGLVYGTGEVNVVTDGTERLKVDSSGRVGINNSSPPATLSVDALAGNATVCLLKSPTANSYLQLGNSTNDQGYLGYQSSDMTLYTAGTERLRITSAGRAGIGTSSPSTKLHVEGDLKVVNTGVAYLQPSTVTAFQAYESSGPAKINLNNNGSATFEGNVGIGTTSGSAKLSIKPPNTATNKGKWSDCGFAIGNSTIVGEYSQIGLGYFDVGTYASAYFGYTSTSQAAFGKGDIVFGTRDVTTDSQPTERLRIQSGGGISFNGDTATANALDDYEEGTWSPTVEGSTTAGSTTTTYSLGTYTKIGRLVHVNGYVSWSSATGTGALYLRGLPFTIQNNGSYGGPAINYWHNLNQHGSGVNAIWGIGSDFIYFYSQSNGSSASQIVMENTGSIIIGGAFYV